MRWLIARLLYYPTLAWNMLLGRVLKVRNWWDEVDPNVIVGAMPLASDVARMKDAGVVAVVNTCQEYPGPIDEYEKAGITQLRVETIDFTHPSLESVEAAVEFMNQQLVNGGKIYVHCKAGRARSATVAICWLMANRGLNPDEGQRLLLEKRPHINPRLTERPVVQQFWEKISKSSSVDQGAKAE